MSCNALPLDQLRVRVVAAPKRPAVIWIYDIPAWLFMPAAAIVCCILAAAGLAFTRARFTRNELINHNDVAGAILATMGTILAVMMSFMVVGVWQEYDGAAQTAQTEAGALSDLHHLADAFPDPFRSKLKSKVDKYIDTVIHVEWPLMRKGGESLQAHFIAYEIETLVSSYSPKTTAQAAVQSNAISTVQKFLDARRLRIHDNEETIPGVLWATLLFIGLATVLFSYYFRVDQPVAQYVMVIALTSVIALTFTLMAELDLPFRGDIAVQPHSFERAYNTIHNIGLER